MNPVRIRIAVSFFIFTLFLFLFCGGEKISSFLASTLLPFQFVPALVRSFTSPSAIFMIGLIFLVFVTLIFGRIYCSLLCPLGTLQDIFIALSGKFGRRKKHSYRKPHHLLRYAVLMIVIASVFLGSMSLLNLFDPYSIMGRFITQFALPFFLLLYNTATGLMKYFHIYFFSRDTAPLVLSVLLVNIAFVILISMMALKYGRLYCNTLCPVGTLLGLLSHVSLFKFAIDKTGCTACLKCEGVCKAGCIDSQNAVIDRSRCVSCFNCLAACPQSVVSYRLSLRNQKGSAWSPARRSVLIGSLATAGSAILMLSPGIRNLFSPAHASASPPITPPGSLSLEHFTKTCSACHLCVSACPTKVLQPTFLGYGISGLLQPQLNYAQSFCDHECNICGQLCPTGAIRPLSLEEKQITQIGQVDLLKDRCVVYVKNENCGACVEVCPTKTIRFIDKGNILYPEVDNRYCVGCGACTHACPTTPKSIVVRPNQVHKKAEKQNITGGPTEQKSTVPEEFPF